MNPTLMYCALSAVGALVVFGIPLFFAGVSYRKRIAEAEIGSAEQEAKKLMSEAIKSAEVKKKEALVEAKDDIYKLRQEAEKEIKERRSELSRQERRIVAKEETLDKKVENLEQKDELLQKKLRDADDKLAEADEIKKREFEMLERISGLTAEQARAELLNAFENDLIHDKAVKLNYYNERYKEESEEKAREYIAVSIQRLAAEFVTEATVSVVPLPNDEMKGRIIGREGRNIRAIETLTGCDIIIDDTPEAITLSCHDPVRREIARQSLEKLIVDGRIHPTRIEEMVDKAKRDVEQKIKQSGEKAIMDTGVHGIHSDIVKLLGRLKYRTSFGQNVLNHSIEVSFIAGMLAAELGADVNLARRAGLLHDIGKSIDQDTEGSHIQIGVDIAKKYKENQEVVHAIEAHHGDVEPKTVIACIVAAADAISAARPGARRENVENFIKRLERLEEIANSFDGVEKTFAIQAGREIRIIVRPDIVDDDRMVLLAREIAGKIETDLDYPGQIKVHIIRENRAIEYAK